MLANCDHSEVDSETEGDTDFLTEQDFASAVAQASHMSGLTVVK